MSDRRFTDKPGLDPTAVRSLPADHPAMVENRTLFPTTVVTVDEHQPARLLVSGKENRKLGQVVTKGRFKGYALYALSLEERATCPVDCDARAFCYGNGMQMARRHRIGDEDVFFDRLGLEVLGLLDANRSGLLIRLHVLGDFPSVKYVEFWAELLIENPAVAVYGYTHRRPTDRGGDAIGDAIFAAKQELGDRFRIRWSVPAAEIDQWGDATTIIDYEPAGYAPEGVVCPAQTDATACCATYGLCWDKNGIGNNIAFIKHGPRSAEAALKAEAPPAPGPTRAIEPITIPSRVQPNPIAGGLPQVRMVRPQDLRVEAAYQRGLTERSVTLIRKIVSNWEWTKFKAVDLEEPVLTPSGWTKHGELLPGDRVFGPDGKQIRVIARTQVFEDADCYRVTFCDGYSVVVSGDHLWTVDVPDRARVGAGRRNNWRVETLRTADLKGKVDFASSAPHRRFPRIAVAAAVQLPTRSLPLDPYVLGAWLGDGHVGEPRITAGSEDVAAMTANLEGAGVSVRLSPQRGYFRLSIGNGRHAHRGSSDVVNALRELGVYRDKHIPAAYLHSAEHQRLALLQGLMDTDGSCSNGRAIFCSANPGLAASVHELVMSLGIRAVLAQRWATYKGLPRSFWQVQFFPPFETSVFRLSRKANEVREGDERPRYRRVVSIESVPSRPVSCIQVDRSDGLYLVGRHLVTTHNCPVTAQTPDGLFVIDGQHTSIAAASHPGIDQIPVLVVSAANIEARAESFVAHNRDRLNMSVFQIFHAEVAAGSHEAKAVLDAVAAAGGVIPRNYVSKSTAVVGEITALKEVRKIYRSFGADMVRRIVGIAVQARVAPVSTTVVLGLRHVLTEPIFSEAAELPDERLAATLASIQDIEATAQRHAGLTGQNRYRACAALIADLALMVPA